MTSLPLWVQLVALGIPVLVAIFSAVWATRAAKRAQTAEHEAQRLRDLEERVAQRKYDLYQPFVQAMGDTLTPSRSEAALAGFEDVIADFQTFVTIWASDEVVDAFLRYRLSANNPPPAAIMMRLVADLLLAIRRDVAHPDSKLTGIHTIGMRLNDIADHPELTDAMRVPLRQLFAEHAWEPPLKDDPVWG
jgi:hypothetical protein